jgi:hypothetical protein
LETNGWLRIAGNGRLALSHFDDFFREATSREPGSDTGLDAGELYGLYESWCLITGCPPESAKALWGALAARGVIPGRNTLSMSGPAAADYIVSSAPDLP